MILERSTDRHAAGQLFRFRCRIMSRKRGCFRRPIAVAHERIGAILAQPPDRGSRNNIAPSPYLPNMQKTIWCLLNQRVEKTGRKESRGYLLFLEQTLIRGDVQFAGR